MIKDKLIKEGHLEILNKYWNKGKIMSEAHKGKIRSEETRRKISESTKGEKNPFWGKTHSEESKRKQSEKRKGKYTGEENPFWGKTHSEEAKGKQSESKKGEKNPNWGKPRSEETKILIGEGNKGKKHSEETRKKRSEKQKEAWRDPNSVFNSKEYREKHRQRMLNGHAVYMNSFIKNPSNPQVKLFKLVKELFSEAVLNYPVFEFNRSIDVCIPHLKIALEYDEPYWHDLEQDEIRQIGLESLGYRFIRYERRIPTLEELENDINNIIVL